MRYLKRTWTSLNAVDVYAIDENGYEKVSIDEKNICVEKHFCSWMDKDDQCTEKNGYIPIEKGEFLLIKAQAIDKL